jgi:hypothetical protein
MGLAVEVGFLATLLDDDPEGGEWLREGLAVANRILALEGLPTHSEPETLPPLQSRACVTSFPYSFLHYLRYAYACRIVAPDWIATPLPDDFNPLEAKEVDDQINLIASHLICHSDCEGYYLPVDFSEILVSEKEPEEDDLPGGLLGSSYRLQEELVLVAPALGIRLENGVLSDDEAARINELADRDDGLFRELLVWLALYEAARLSIEYRTAIVFA